MPWICEFTRIKHYAEIILCEIECTPDKSIDIKRKV